MSVLERLRRLLTVSVLASLMSPLAYSQRLLPGEHAVSMSAIPGVVDATAQWELVWADFVTADGIVGMPDGSVLFAQEQTDSIHRLDPDGKDYVFLENVYGAGSVAMDHDGRIYAVLRTCTEPLNDELARCEALNSVNAVYPERRILTYAPPSALRFRFLGRLSDLVADGQGGVYFTAVGAYHVDSAGRVRVVEDENIQSNGIMLNTSGKLLYVTNSTEVLAFDVGRDGQTSNRRVFASLEGDDGADGMTIDAEDRLYVTANGGIHVYSSRGDQLGLIETPRRPITIAFAGPDKRTIYVPMMGAVGPDGKPWTTPDGIRNTAMTIYRLQMSAQGYLGRPK